MGRHKKTTQGVDHQTTLFGITYYSTPSDVKVICTI